MAILEIKKYPDDVLKKKATPVENFDSDLHRLIDDMVETMYAASGIGLAATQVAVSKRLIVVDVSTKEEKYPLVVLINPEIIETDDFVDSEEGCLSIPGYISTIKRAEKIIVRGLDRNGKSIQFEADGLFARAIQHEIDHLDGILFVDRMSYIKREFFKKRYLKKAVMRNA
jgi:peptide deformylase